MGSFSGYRCSLCSTEYATTEKIYTCPKDGGNLDILLDYDALRQQVTSDAVTKSQEFSIWRYLPLLPVSDPGGQETTLHAVGWTPLFSPQPLREKTGLQHLWIKDESRNPTGSFKDRASSVVIARARQIKANIVVTASTGNAGAALAGMGAAIGQKTIIFAPKNAPPAKIAQLLIYGSQVILVDGNYDQAFDLAIEASLEFGWYCRNTGYNPFTAEGKKTAAFEIWEALLEKDMKQSKKWQTPLSVFIPVGDGNIISGIHKGFKDLLALGWLDKMPRLFGVQAEGSAAIANGFHQGKEEIQPVIAQTVADSISVDLPRDGIRAIRAAVQTGGSYLCVKDADILKAMATMGAAGIFAEPAGATAYAGLEKAIHEGIIAPDDPVVVLNTGNGLKDVQAAMEAVRPAPIIEPSMKALKRYLEK